MPRRSDILEHWRSRGTISPMQFQAGRWFERVFDIAAIEGCAALDISRPHVDVSPPVHTPIDRAKAARDELGHLKRELGTFDFALVCRVLGRGEPVAPDPRNASEDAERRYLARRLRDALGVMNAR